MPIANGLAAYRIRAQGPWSCWGRSYRIPCAPRQPSRLLPDIQQGLPTEGRDPCACWLGRDRRLAGLDAGDDVGGILAGLVGGEGVAVLAEGHALRAVEGAGLDDEDLLAGGVDPDAEPEQVAVPEDGVLAIDGETVDDALGEGVILALRHDVVLRGE